MGFACFLVSDHTYLSKVSLFIACDACLYVSQPK